MEESNLLKKISSRKIEELTEASTPKKSAIMLDKYGHRSSRPTGTNSNCWLGQKKLDHHSNVSVNPTMPNTLRGSKYRYVVDKNSVRSRSNSTAYHRSTSLSNSNVKSYPTAQERPMVKNTSLEPTSVKTHTNMYINPHFARSKIISPSLELNASTILKDRIQLNYELASSMEVNAFHNYTTDIKSSELNNSSYSQFKSSVLSSNTGVLNEKSNQIYAKKTIHINPLVVSSKDKTLISADNAKKSVHVNPTVFARLKTEVKREKPQAKHVSTGTLITQPNKVSENLNKSLISLSGTKLVRARRSSLHRALLNQNTPRSRILSASKSVASPLVKIVKSVRSKYKYIRQNLTPTGTYARPVTKASPFMRTKYKLDRRVQKTPKCFKQVQKYSIKYESSRQNKTAESNLQGIMLHKRASFTKSPFSNRVWGSRSFQLQRVIITDRKLLKIGSTPNVKQNLKKLKRPNSTSSTLVRIGGLLYKTSRTKLTRSNVSQPKKTRVSLFPQQTSTKKSKSSGGHVVHVRGNKFLLDASGKTLCRVSCGVQSVHSQMKRIDIGGATFVQKSANVLIRTNNHAVRSMLSQAKQKSIDLLTKKMRKNNTVCKFYRRFGKCFREEKGRCPCVHDKKYVAICKRYLSGECTKEGCLLSHELIPEKMPTCKYFLQACCSREVCPYLHVKLNASAPLCVAFLQGYCADGIKCRKWHFLICPQYDKTGNCPKGKYCPFPHELRKNMELTRDHMEVNVERIMKLYEERQRELREGKPKPEEKTIRYFNYDSDPVVDEEDVGELVSDQSEAESDVAEKSTTDISLEEGGRCSSSDDESNLLRNRPKLGVLPSYIPLN